MRKVYDYFGCDRVLGEKVLTNALGDVLPDSKRLRSQLAMALDAGVGRQYLHQLKTCGKPDEAFQRRVRKLLTEDAELSDTRAAEIMGFFDEMIGWELPKAGNTGGGNSSVGTKPTGEIPRPGGWSPPGRQPQPEPQPQPKPKPVREHSIPHARSFGAAAWLIMATLSFLYISFLEYNRIEFDAIRIIISVLFTVHWGVVAFFYDLYGKSKKWIRVFFGIGVFGAIGSLIMTIGLIIEHFMK